MAVEAPDNFDEGISLLPDDQPPFGVNCLIALGIQTVLFHYQISAKEVEDLEGEELFTLRDFRLANPEGGAEERAVFRDSVAPLFPKAVRCLCMKNCIRHILATANRPGDGDPASKSSTKSASKSSSKSTAKASVKSTAGSTVKSSIE